MNVAAMKEGERMPLLSNAIRTILQNSIAPEDMNMPEI
jgi:hypothetical protein